MNRIAPALLILIWMCSCQKSSSPGNNTTNPGDTTAAITSVGTPQGSPVTKTIGNAGGTISSADGRLELIIPAGSLGSDVAFVIQPVTNLCPGGIGLAYDLLPNGTKFSSPATLRFHYTPDDVNGTDPYLISFAFQDSLHKWNVNLDKDVDTAGKTVSFDINHFTPYAPMADVRIISVDLVSGLPKTDFLQGEQSILRVVDGLTDIQWTGDETLPFLPAVSRVADNLMSAWGVQLGSPNGNISGTGSQVNYSAPASISTDRIIYDSAVFGKNATYKDRKGNTVPMGPRPLYINLHLHPNTLSFLVQVDVHIDSTSDVYKDDYHDSASFRVDVMNMSVTMSNIFNQAPTVTPSSGSSGATTATWAPDGIGVTNILGEQLGVAYDSSNLKVVNILFSQTGTVTPSWKIHDPVLGDYTVDSAPVPGFPAGLSFVGVDSVQFIKPLQGTGSLGQVTFTITPIH
jgi:hypothetical protein